jgi:Type VI secretion system VasI, EvfG, VC_A0118
MKNCPWCGVPFDGAEPFCTNCGKEREEPAPPPPQSKTGSRRRLFSRRSRAAVGVAAGLVVVTITLVRSQSNSPVPNDPIAVAAATTAPAPAAHPSRASSVITASPPPPTWAGRRQTSWARDGSKTIAFQLDAIEDVPIWMTRVRPVLVVRCLYRGTDVFVATNSAASIEPKSDRHTVRVRLDDEPEELQQWSESASAQELIAPDGIALARRLVRAREMRFGFTPYNAKPVTAQFHVEGFDRLVGLVAKTCGWRAD